MDSPAAAKEEDTDVTACSLNGVLSIMSTEKISLKSIEDQYFNAVGDKVIATLETAFDLLHQTSIGDAARATATELQTIITSEAQSNIEWVFESLWEAVVNIAKRVPHRHQGQQLLVQVLLDLNVKEESFKGLDALGSILRDNWIDPTFETVEGEPETYSLDEWLNINSFAARISKAGIIGGQTLAVWQLRHGLEENLPADATASNSSRVAVASEWLIQASPIILRRCLVQKQEDLDEDLKRSFGGGELYTGLPGYDIERWGFWKRRLLALREGAAPGLADVTGEAVDAMQSAVASLLQ